MLITLKHEPVIKIFGGLPNSPSCIDRCDNIRAPGVSKPARLLVLELFCKIDVMHFRNIMNCFSLFEHVVNDKNRKKSEKVFFSSFCH